MRLTTTGIATDVIEPVVGRVTTVPVADRSHSILVGRLAGQDLNGYRGLITTDHKPPIPAAVPMVFAVREIEHLHDGDIVVMHPRGLIRTIFTRDSTHNALFVTEQCNSNCMMCSQPPKDHEDVNALLRINRELIPLIPKDAATIGITGGEPTLLGSNLFGVVELLRDHLPNTAIHLLTNARRFARPEYTKGLAQVHHPELVLGIPLYSDMAVLHDYIVQDRGAFDQTVTGLHNLARWGIAVEVRIVLHSLTIPRLLDWAEYVYRNVPFVVHVAFMGLEPTGHAAYHHEKLWIAPADYQKELAAAVEFLSIRGMNISIYNLQHCVLPQSLWAFARRSISDWKNKYVPACTGCSQRDHCAGFFESADARHTNNIQAIH